MIQIRIKPQGIDKLASGMQRLDVRNAIAEAINISIVEANKRAIYEVPVDTSQLQKSHQLDPASSGNLEGRVYTNLEYAVPVHEGHQIVAWGRRTGKRKAANPWMKRAAESVEPKVKKIFESVIDKLLRQL